MTSIEPELAPREGSGAREMDSLPQDKRNRVTTPRDVRGLRVRLAIVVGLCVVAVLFVTVFRLPQRVILDTGAGVTAAGPVTATATYVQPLAVDGRARITAVEVLLSTWGQPVSSTHDRLTLFGEDGVALASAALPPGSVADDEYRRLGIEPSIDLASGSRLYVCLSSVDGSRARSVTALSTDALGQSPYFVLSGTRAASGSPVARLSQARPVQGALCVRVLGVGARTLAVERTIAVSGFALCLAAAAIVLFARPLLRSAGGRRLVGPIRRVRVAGKRWWDHLTIPRLYLAVALVWGLVMVFLVPPFQVPDEPNHYFRAWSVAELQLLARDDATVTLPENVASLPERLGSAVPDWTTSHYSPADARRIVWEPLSPKTTQARLVTVYGPLGYVPGAAGIELARLLGHSPVLGLYLGRIANLAFCVLIVFAAISMLPFGRPLMALMALLPMTVAEMASVSADGVALSGALLVTAMVLNFSQRDRISARDLMWFGVAATLLLNAKPGYALMAFLGLAFLPRQLGGMRRWVVGECAVLAAALGVAAILLVVSPPVPGPFAGVDLSAQLRLVVQDPLFFARVLLATLNANAFFLAQGTFGILGLLSVALPVIGMLLSALVIVLFLGSQETVPTSLWQRCVLAGTGAAVSGAICLALYMQWTVVGAPVVNGLQGRYFIPPLTLGLFALYGIRLTRQRTIVAILLVVVIIFAVMTIRALVGFYY